PDQPPPGRAPSRDHARDDPRARVRERGARRDPRAPRALGRLRLPARPGWHRDSAGRAHPGRGGRVGEHDPRSPLPAAAGALAGDRRAAQDRWSSLRPRSDRGVRARAGARRGRRVKPKGGKKPEPASPTETKLRMELDRALAEVRKLKSEAMRKPAPSRSAAA